MDVSENKMCISSTHCSYLTYLLTYIVD